jgi:hypothetical protein
LRFACPAAIEDARGASGDWYRMGNRLSAVVAFKVLPSGEDAAGRKELYLSATGKLYGFRQGNLAARTSCRAAIAKRPYTVENCRSRAMRADAGGWES